MHIKPIPMLKTKPLLITIIAMHIVPLVFMMYADRVLNEWLPSLFLVLIPLFFMLFRSSPAEEKSTPNAIGNAMRIIVMALGGLIALFMIAYFSLSFQPLIAADTGEVLWVHLPGAENMAYVIRLFLQAWLFALVCVMASRWLKNSNHYSGFLLRFYEKKHMLPWLLDFVVIGGVVFIVTALIMMASQQVFYVVSRLLGFERLFAFPQMTLFIFLFALYALNRATSFSARVEHYAKKSHASMPLIYLACIGFTICAWLFSQVALLGLPEATQTDLAQALDTRVASLDKIMKNWPTLVMGCSLFMVAPLSVLLSRVLTSHTLLMVAIIAPLALAAFFLTTFPAINAVFWTWVPELSFTAAPITDTLAKMTFNGFSVMLILLVVGLLCAMSKGGLWMKSMVEISPDTLGRRERRVRINFAKFFKPFCFIYGVFGAFGVYGLSMNASMYIPTILTACSVLICLGLYHRFYKRVQMNTLMEVTS